MIRSRDRSRGGSNAWYSQPSLALNSVMPSYISQFDRNRYYTSTAGVRAFPHTSVRTSNAMHFDASLRLVHAPANMILHSEDLTNAAWTKTDSTITANTETAPSGASADLVTEGTAGTALVQQVVAGMQANGLFCLTFEIKRGNHDWMRCFIGSGGNTLQVWFNLGTGAVGTSTSAGTNISPATATMTAIGGGWFRCSVFAGNFSSTSVTILTVSAAADASTTRVNNATRTMGRHQLELYGVDSPKLPLAQTAASAYYGPRLDYNPSTGAARGLLSETARTNSIPNSWALGGGVGVTPTSWVIAAGSGISCSVSAVGYEDGMPYVDFTFSGTASGAVSPTIQFSGSNTIAAVAGQTWAGGLFIRRVGGNETNTITQQIIPRDAAVALLTAFGSVTVSGLSSTSIGKNRVISAGTAPASTAWVSLRLVKTYVLNDVASDVIRVALPQLEGTAVTSLSSPIATYSAAAASRAADTYQEAIAAWYDQAKGTIYTVSEHVSAPTSGFANLAGFSDGTANNREVTFMNLSSGAVSMEVTSGGVSQTPSLSVAGTVNQVNKVAGRWISNSVQVSRNGVAGTTDTTATIPGSLTTISIGMNATLGGQTDGWIREARYYPDASASDAQLNALTV